MNWSTYALSCTTPRVTNTGPKFLATVRTSGDWILGYNGTRCVSRSTAGSCTANITVLATTEPHAYVTASCSTLCRPPNASSVAISTAFHATGAEYDSRKRP